MIVLNGQKTADVQDSTHASGPFALQYGSGVVKFRKVKIYLAGDRGLSVFSG